MGPYPVTELPSEGDAPSTGQRSSGGRRDQPSPIAESSETTSEQSVGQNKVRESFDFK